jgi:inner membrane protein
MPTILTHMAVPLAIGAGLGNRAIPRRLLVAGMLGSMLPDLDVAGFRLGIEYASDFGHRGFSHSLVFAAMVALLCSIAWRYFHASAGRVFLFMLVSIALHGLLDCLTNGGHGVALLWPFSSHRFFAPFQPIQVSPIGLSRFLSSGGLAVLMSEAIWVWLPCLALGMGIRFASGIPRNRSDADMAGG